MNRVAGLSRLWPAVFLAAALGSVAACAEGSSSNYGQGFGTVSLAAGQTRQVWMGPSYRLVRVCNDFSSTGTVTAILDDQPATTLSPGRCTEDYGNRIQFTNTGGGTATLTYRSIVEPFTP
ncbi:MAG TPA: hypothetical protein VN821_11170 [Candidatus Udaeobacter sp.]|nr:hypothetical protein [Candidatus Udaeobacter sp.]